MLTEVGFVFRDQRTSRIFDIMAAKTKPNRRFQFRLSAVLIFVLLIGVFLAVHEEWKKIDFSFQEFDEYYMVEMLENVDFLGEQSCHVYVILEEGQTAPTLRQRWLIYRMQRYDQSLRVAMDGAANENRIDFEEAVGDLTAEYGLPVMNRENIGEHYGFEIKIPRLADSPDDYIVLSCHCTWEQEHGMEMLIRNGREVPWQGNDGPWQWNTPTEFMASGQ